MTIVGLLDALKLFIESKVNDMAYPTAVQKGDTEQKTKVPEVFRMRLPDSDIESIKKVCPYVIIQFVNSMDKQEPGQRGDATAVIRFIFAVYDKDEQTGAILLLNLMERIRIALLKNPVVGGCYKLDTSTGLETMVYPDDTAPYYAGEMVGTFWLPSIEREVTYG